MDETFSELRRLHEGLLNDEVAPFAQAFNPNGGYEHKDFKRTGGDELAFSSHVAAGHVADLVERWLGGTGRRELAGWRAVENAEARTRIKGASSCVFAAWGYTGFLKGRRARVEYRVTSRMWLNGSGEIIWMETERII